MKTKIFSVLFFLLLSSCANKMTLPGDYEIQLTPEKGKIEQLGDIKISYLVPNNMLGSEDIDGLVFSSRQWGESIKREKILTSYGDTNLQIERRTDNGVAGSGLIYSIDID